jgi:hypothetical protein
MSHGKIAEEDYRRSIDYLASHQRNEDATR